MSLCINLRENMPMLVKSNIIQNYKFPHCIAAKSLICIRDYSIFFEKYKKLRIAFKTHIVFNNKFISTGAKNIVIILNIHFQFQKIRHPK